VGRGNWTLIYVFGNVRRSFIPSGENCAFYKAAKFLAPMCKQFVASAELKRTESLPQPSVCENLRQLLYCVYL